MDEDDVILVFSPLVLLGTSNFYRSQCFWFCVRVARIGRLRVVCPPSDGRLRKIDTFAKESIALWKHRNQENRSNSREGVDLVDDFSAFVTFASKRHCTALSSFCWRSFLRFDEAILSLSLGFRKLTPWHWNRFIVPLERGAHGILAGHGVLGVQKPGAKSTSSTSCPSPEMVKETLKRRKVINSDTLTPFKVPLPPPSKQEQQKFFEMRDKQWQAFCQRLQMQGRVPAMGPGCDEEEKRRQMMEWREFLGESRAWPQPFAEKQAASAERNHDI